MTEEQKQKFLKQKAVIENNISAMTSGQVEYDESSIADLFFSLGTVNYDLEDYDEAIRCYKEALPYYENCLEDFPYGLYAALGDAHKKKEDYQNAVKYAAMSYENTMEYYLSDPEGSFNYMLELCLLHLKAGNYSNAKIILDRVAGHEYSDLEIVGKTAQLYYYYFGYYYATDDIENAIAYGEKAYKEIVDVYGFETEDALFVKTELENIKRNQ